MPHHEGLSPGRLNSLMQADHARLSDLLDNACPHDGVDFGVYQRFRGGLLRHIGMEEKVLLPAVRKLRAGVDLPMAAQLKLDHAALAALLVPTPTREIIGRIKKLLDLHNAIEEGPSGLYAACEGIVGAEIDALCDRLEAVPPVSLAPYRDGPKTFEAIERLMLATGRK
jgi:hypothetical protein